MQLLASMPLSGMGDILAAAKAQTGRDYTKGYVYTYVEDFADVSIAAGGQASAVLNIQNDADFLVRQVHVSARLTAAATNAVAGTPLSYSGLPNSDNNELPTMELVRLMIRDADQPWFSKAVRATHFGGNVANPGYVLSPPVIRRNNAVEITLYNDAAVAVNAAVSLIGMKVYG